jgi:hypothetical protein
VVLQERLALTLPQLLLLVGDGPECAFQLNSPGVGLVQALAVEDQ